jgi:hypothetical protein
MNGQESNIMRHTQNRIIRAALLRSRQSTRPATARTSNPPEALRQHLGLALVIIDDRIERLQLGLLDPDTPEAARPRLASALEKFQTLRASLISSVDYSAQA